MSIGTGSERTIQPRDATGGPPSAASATVAVEPDPLSLFYRLASSALPPRADVLVR